MAKDMPAEPMLLRCYRYLMTSLSLILPYYLARRAKQGKETYRSQKERRGLYQTPPPKADRTIWLHAVSVGEASAALSLADALQKADPDHEMCFIFTTGTVTAARMIQEKTGDLLYHHLYAPFDAPAMVTRFFDHCQPDIGVIFESDFWPMMMITAHHRQIPLYLASAQMSDASVAQWQKYPSLANAIFAPVKAGFMTDAKQAQIFAKMGLLQTQITGTLKLPSYVARQTSFAKELRQIAGEKWLILAASTHPSEEQQILAVSAYLHAKGIDHLLVIAPRHLDRADEVARLCDAIAGGAKRRSQGALPAVDDSVYLCDSMGEMPSLYQAADIVWLGASFSGRGGHNPLEAASYGKPILCGPSQFKNQYEFDQLHEQGVCITTSQTAHTAQMICDVMQDDDRRAVIAKAGKAYASKARKRAGIVAKQILQDQMLEEQKS